MKRRSTTWMILLVSAARNVVSHRMKSLVVGFILMFGAMLLVVGTAFLGSVEQSMERTVTASLAGHLQVYSSEADDELALFGGGAIGGDDYGEIEDFGRVREALETVPNVEAVVPMGITTARVIASTRLDEVIGRLRDAVRGEAWSDVESLRMQLTVMAEQLRSELENRKRLEADPEAYSEDFRALERLQSGSFWEEALREEPTEALQFLDTEIAPLSNESRMIFLRTLGTDPVRFARHFDRFQIVEGNPIPEGKRGMLVSKYIYEHHLKNTVARGFDEVREKLREGETIAGSDALTSRISRMKRNYRTLVFGLSPAEMEQLTERLRRLMPNREGDLKELLQAFLSLNDGNFEARHEAFYEEIAPLIRLYEFRVGDTLTLQSMGQRGFTRSANVKLWGVYSFRGLEDLELAGSMTLVDMVTFRELYGVMSDEARRELSEIQRQVDVEEVDRDSAERELFGEASGPVVESAGEENTGHGDLFGRVERQFDEAPSERGLDESYDPEAIDDGLARNAAVLLEDRARLEETRAEIEGLIERRGLALDVLDWQRAAGVVGQFVTVIQLVLYVSITIIFLVALVIINNSMVMATVERTGEIGTMRAIGAPRWYVSTLFVVETVLLGSAAGLVGSALGAGIVAVAGWTGIPATSDVLRFLFSGDYLYPTLRLWNVAIGVGSIVVASALSTLYPATLATRIQPVEAMREQH